MLFVVVYCFVVLVVVCSCCFVLWLFVVLLLCVCTDPLFYSLGVEYNPIPMLIGATQMLTATRLKKVNLINTITSYQCLISCLCEHMIACVCMHAEMG